MQEGPLVDGVSLGADGGYAFGGGYSLEYRFYCCFEVVELVFRRGVVLCGGIGVQLFWLLSCRLLTVVVVVLRVPLLLRWAARVLVMAVVVVLMAIG